MPLKGYSAQKFIRQKEGEKMAKEKELIKNPDTEKEKETKTTPEDLQRAYDEGFKQGNFYRRLSFNEQRY